MKYDSEHHAGEAQAGAGPGTGWSDRSVAGDEHQRPGQHQNRRAAGKSMDPGRRSAGGQGKLEPSVGQRQDLETVLLRRPLGCRRTSGSARRWRRSRSKSSDCCLPIKLIKCITHARALAPPHGEATSSRPASAIVTPATIPKWPCSGASISSPRRILLATQEE